MTGQKAGQDRRQCRTAGRAEQKAEQDRTDVGGQEVTGDSTDDRR